jgi:hypothetical protein
MSRETLRWVGWLGLLFSLAPAAPAQEPTPAPTPTAAERLVAVRGTRLVHTPSCATLRRVRPALRVDLPPGLDAARAQGYQPCAVCKPGGAPAGDPKPDAAQPKSEPATADGPLRFSRDIAPILVANCAGCHNAGDKARRNNFDLTTFNALRKGGDAGDPVDPGKPADSLMIRHINGDGVPKMPPGQRDLADGTVARLERWITEGARLDAGISPDAQLASYAPTPEQMRRDELARLSASERDGKLEAAGRDRWKKTGAEPPTVTPGASVLLFGALPEERAAALVRTLDAQVAAVRALLGPVAAPVLSGPEKISVYVFNDPLRYIEFVRSVENREVEVGAQAHGNLGVPAPYLAAIDPRQGAPEPPATKGAARGRAKAQAQAQAEGDGPGASGRALAGLLCEALAAQAAQVSGKPPRWLALGLGAFVASGVEPRSPYYAGLRREVAELYRSGWAARVAEVLADQDNVDVTRAVGFSLLEWLGTTWRPTLAPIVRDLTRDGAKLDDVLRAQLRASRDQVLQAWGGFVATRYGRGR